MRSLRQFWALAAVMLGWLIGSSIDRLPVGALARGVVSMVLTWNVGLMLVSSTWLFVSPFASENMSPRPFRTVVLTSLAAAIVATLVHYGAASVSKVDPELMRHQAASLGVFGAIAGMVQGMIARGSEEFE
jgi:uncharacterized membrane protein AbrB (regulator of aidB expression)